MGVGPAGGSELLSRSAEIALIEDAVASARAGRGRVVVVTGPAGIGKSSLLRVAENLAGSRDTRVLRAVGREMETLHAFSIARRLLSSAGADDVLDASGSPRTVDATIERLLRLVAGLVWPDPADARHRALLLAVDDVQWADLPSVRFLTTLAGRVDELPLVLVLTLRPGERPEVDTLVESALGRAHVAVLRPAPLEPEAVATVIDDHAPATPELAAAVHEVTGGNPFYTHAVARLLAERGERRPEAVSGLIPEEVLRSVVARLARLGPVASELAAALAVLGDEVPLRLVAELADLDGPTAERAADALAGAGILSSGDPLRFAHPLVASAVSAEQPAFAVSRRQRRAAELLAAAGAAPERIGSHLMETRPDGDPEVVAYLRAAATAAVHQGHPDAAVGFLQRARDEPPTGAVREEVALELLEARARAADRTMLDDVDELLAELRSAAHRARALGIAATLAHHVLDLSVAIELAQRGLDELPEDRRETSDLFAQWVSSAYLHPAHHQEATAVIHGVIAEARAGRFDRSPSLAALAAAEATYDQPDEVVHRLARAAFADDPLVDGDTFGTGLGYAAAALLWTDAFNEVTERMDDALEHAGHHGALVARTVAHHWRGIAAFHEGRLEDALVDAEHAAALQELGWTDSGWSTPLLIEVRLARGEPELAAEAVARGEAMNPERPDYLQFLEARARLRLAQDAPEAALDDALTAGAVFAQAYGREAPRAFAWRLIAAEACRRLGDLPRAREYAAGAVERLRPLGTPRQTAEALTELAAASPDEEACVLLGEAMDVLEGSTAHMARTRALLVLGCTERRLGRQRAARDHLYAAFELADEAGALPLATAIRRELNALGDRPRRAARTGLASLTPGERRVVDLASAGMSNPQIAHHLVISRRTVETHLGRAYRKLGVTGRGDLAAVVGS